VDDSRIGAPLAGIDRRGEVGALRRGDPEFVGARDRFEDAFALAGDPPVVGIEASGKYFLGDPWQGHDARAGLVGGGSRAGMTHTPCRRTEYDVGRAHRRSDRLGRLLAVLLPRWVPSEEGIVGDPAGGPVECLADR